MTIEEKLQHFMDVTVNDANIKRQTIVDEYKAGMDKIYEDHKANALKNVESLKNIEKDEIRRKTKKDFSKQQQLIRRDLTKKMEELKETIFNEVSLLLSEYKKTPAYSELLIKQIKNSLAIARNEEITIYIDPEDSDKLSLLEEKTGVSISISAYSFMGGMRATIASKNILIDNSFESKLSDAKDDFIISL